MALRIVLFMPAAVFELRSREVTDEPAKHTPQLLTDRDHRFEFLTRYVFFRVCPVEAREHLGQGPFRVIQVFRKIDVGGLLEPFPHVRRNGIVRVVDLLPEVAIFAIRQKDVLDIASGIYSIRRNPPAKPRRMEIWSDGRVYQVVVTPGGEEMRQLPGGAVKARHYTIRGVPGAGRRWKGKLDLWLATDEAATPVEIRISRNLADVHLQLVEPVG